MKRRHRSLTVSIVWIAILGALLLIGTTSSAIDTANNADDVDVDEQDLQQSCSANSDDMETCVNTQQLSDNEDDNEEDNFEEMNDREQPNEEEEEVDYDDIDTEGDELAGVSPNVWGKPQVIKKVFQQSIAPLLEEIETYMKSTVYSDPQYDTIKYKCRNMDKQCTEWASQGSCEDDAEYSKYTTIFVRIAGWGEHFFFFFGILHNITVILVTYILIIFPVHNNSGMQCWKHVRRLVNLVMNTFWSTFLWKWE